MRRPKLIRNLWYGARHELGRTRPGFAALRLTPRADPALRVSRRTDVCVEGFARSGNTFAFMVVREWNPGLRIAHHVHVPGQVTRAARLGIPCAVLIREPLDVLTSLMVFSEGQLSPRLAVRSYIRYYECVAEIRERVHLCAFDELRRAPETLVAGLNARFGTRLRSEPMSEADKARILAEISRYHRNRGRSVASYSVPRPEKEHLKPRMREAIRSQPRFPIAEAVYQGLVGPAQVPSAE